VPGYFDDGTIDVRLGAYAFVTPAEVRRNVVLEPHAAPAVVLDSGGGVQELAVTCQAVRANLGDAERWIYGLLRALALSDPGELGFTDSLGNLAVFGDSVCVGARGEVRALSFADVQMDWLTPAKSGEVAAPHALPALPATYAGTSTALDYAAGGVAIGTARLLPGGRLGRMAVLPDYRGQGVGSALLRHALVLARQRGLDALVRRHQGIGGIAVLVGPIARIREWAGSGQHHKPARACGRTAGQL